MSSSPCKRAMRALAKRQPLMKDDMGQASVWAAKDTSRAEWKFHSPPHPERALAMNEPLKLPIKNDWLVAASNIAAAIIQNAPEKGTPEQLPKTIHQAYFAVWMAHRRLQNGISHTAD